MTSIELHSGDCLNNRRRTFETFHTKAMYEVIPYSVEADPCNIEATPCVSPSGSRKTFDGRNVISFLKTTSTGTYPHRHHLFV